MTKSKNAPCAIVIDGKPYRSKAAAAKAYGVSSKKVADRMRAGWTAAQAVGFALPPAQAKGAVSYTVEGVLYASLRQVALAYDIAIATLHRRVVEQQIPIEKALDATQGSPWDRLRVTVDDIDYTYRQANAHFKVQLETLRDRAERGLTPRQIVGLDVDERPHNSQPVSVEGRDFVSTHAAATHYGVSPKTVSSRQKRGWTLAQALGVDNPPASANVRKGTQITVAEIVYASHYQAAKAHGVKLTTFNNRLARGLTPELAAGLPEPPLQESRP